MSSKTTLAAVTCAALILSGCSSWTEPQLDVDQRLVGDVTWENSGPNTKLQFKAPLAVAYPTVNFIEPGSGEAVAPGDVVVFEVSVFDGQDGSLVSSSYEKGHPEKLYLARAAAEPLFLEALLSCLIGSQFVYVTPARLDEAEIPANLTAPPTKAQPGSVMAVEVVGVEHVLEQVDGEEVAAVPGLPLIDFETDISEPSVTLPEGKPITELTVQPIIKGNGPEVRGDGTMIGRYVGWLWEDGGMFDSIWSDPDPSVFDLAETIQGWSEGLAGVKVGSRVLLIVPPALAYGGVGSGPVPPGATLIFAVDVLGAY